MKHVTAVEKSLLVGDGAADTLAEYAAHVARLGSGDTVQLRAIGVDGDEVVATFVLNSGTALTLESTHSVLPEPDNADAVAYMVAQMAQFDITTDALPGDVDAGG
ncbi:hypothetical protein QDR37_05285 [Amnibacterium sp. CER49]|uniref:hypothetical protein n=1 Tax=Amnibacterium sp. CER49 TaxID=3039161 RepID=UPI002446A9D9|nr:hypothetical protein [Amnibacterium sp. CER49]MDH2443354.1 hypothetical protein [Amnibacterium sp. CER49]